MDEIDLLNASTMSPERLRRWKEVCSTKQRSPRSDLRDVSVSKGFLLRRWVPSVSLVILLGSFEDALFITLVLGFSGVPSVTPDWLAVPEPQWGAHGLCPKWLFRDCHIMLELELQALHKRILY